MEQTKADRLRELEAQYQATSTRTVREDGTVILALELANGDRIAGRGPTTAAALDHLSERVAKFAATEE